MSVLTLVLLCAVLLPQQADAATEGIYTYAVSNGQAEILDVRTTVSDVITVVSTLGGYPVTSIGDEAFYGCSDLAEITIPSGATDVGRYAFSYCTDLTDIVILSGLKKLGYGAFQNCIYLTNITMPSTLTTVDGYAFSSWRRLKNVYYVGTGEQWNTTTIGYSNNYLNTATIYYVSDGWAGCLYLELRREQAPALQP